MRATGARSTAGRPGNGSGVRPEFVASVPGEEDGSGLASVTPRKLPEGSVVARSEIRPCGRSGVGACAALLLLLLQGSPHACGLVPASRGSFFRRHRGLLSVSRRFPVVWTTTTGTTRSERERPGRPAIRAYPRSGPSRHGAPHPLASHGCMASIVWTSIFSNGKGHVHLGLRSGSLRDDGLRGIPPEAVLSKLAAVGPCRRVPGSGPRSPRRAAWTGRSSARPRGCR